LLTGALGKKGRVRQGAEPNLSGTEHTNHPWWEPIPGEWQPNSVPMTGGPKTSFKVKQPKKEGPRRTKKRQPHQKQ